MKNGLFAAQQLLRSSNSTGICHHVLILWCLKDTIHSLENIYLNRHRTALVSQADGEQLWSHFFWNYFVPWEVFGSFRVDAVNNNTMKPNISSFNASPPFLFFQRSEMATWRASWASSSFYHATSSSSSNSSSTTSLWWSSASRPAADRPPAASKHTTCSPGMWDRQEDMLTGFGLTVEPLCALEMWTGITLMYVSGWRIWALHGSAQLEVISE